MKTMIFGYVGTVGGLQQSLTVHKLKLMVDYCQEQFENTNGEVLSDLQLEDFDDVREMVTTMLED